MLFFHQHYHIHHRRRAISISLASHYKQEDHLCQFSMWYVFVDWKCKYPAHFIYNFILKGFALFLFCWSFLELLIVISEMEGLKNFNLGGSFLRQPKQLLCFRAMQRLLETSLRNVFLFVCDCLSICPWR